ncbi:O-antigen ligase family protein [Sulfobacillus thermosulfidooxidans]|uniref:O-antigen ligase family protein n=1 Tax=Sulfobacillus thermosulfidooxidans TaxID=28034 RepID=UPI000425DB99|nr:O-antigen ligase family protein [Sulfobacillus thermosulfidooxidans]
MALVICAVIGLLLGISVWVYPRLFIMNLLVTAVGVEVIHHWYAGIGQYFPWIAVFLAGILQAGPSEWRKWWQFLRHNKEWMAVYGLYLIGIGISTFMGIHVATSLRYALGVPAVLFIAVVIVPWSIEKRFITVKDLFQVIALMGVVLTITAGIAAIVDHLGFPVPVGHHILLAWQWPFANKNTFGMLVTFALPAAVYLAIDHREDGIIRIFWFIVSILLLIGVALSYSRSSWIASMIGVMMFVTFYYGKRGVLAMFGIGIVLLAGLIAKTGLHKWELLWHKGLNGRIVLWKAGLDAMHHHWVWGVGPGNSPLALKPFVPAIYAGLTPSDSILRSAVELGLVGLGLWLLLVGVAMIGLLMRRPWQSWEDNALFSIMLASLAQQVVESLFVGGVSFGDFFFTVFLGIAWYRIWVVPKNRSLRSQRLSRRALLG